MPWKLLAIFALLAAVTAVVWALATVGRTKKQLAHIQAILDEVKRGNGNRRILAEPHEITASLAYSINEIVRSYEERLLTLHKAEEANKQLMTSLSHDVRTPLTTLIGYLDAVQKGIVTGEDREAYFRTARRKAYDLKEYIDVLFDWFKLNSNEFVLHPETVELAEATRTVLIDWVPILEDKQLCYAFDIPEGPLPVVLDVEGYGRVVNNLMQNVLAHSQAEQVQVTLRQRAERVELAIADNGVGMAKEDLQRIFQRLYKCDKGRTEKGSGLGLSIAAQLAERMGGSIQAESVLGEGSTFRLTFPLLA